MEYVEFLASASIYNIMIVVGFVFLLLANVVSIKSVEVRKGGHRILGFVGAVACLLGISIYALEKIPNAIFPGVEEEGKSSGYIVSEKSRITSGAVYSQYGQGDFIFNISNPIDECPSGFWVRPTDPGYTEVIANVRAAISNELNVVASGEPDLVWPGSRDVRCHLYHLGVLSY